MDLSRVEWNHQQGCFDSHGLGCFFPPGGPFIPLIPMARGKVHTSTANKRMAQPNPLARNLVLAAFEL